MKKRIGLGGYLAIVLLLAACSTGDRQETAQDHLLETLRGLGLDRYIGIPYERVEERGDGWKDYHFDPAHCRCVYGTRYRVSTREEESPNVVLYLEGGGACWPEGIYRFTCMPVAISGGDRGWMTRDAVNPLRDWSVVYLPYCDGSVFSGDREVDYSGDGETDRYHWGLRNLSAGVTVMKELFPNPEKILVSGSSAGAYGTFVALGVVRLQYPDAKLYVFNDAGPGLYNPDDPETFRIISETWGFKQFFPPDCADCEVQPSYLARWYLEQDPQVRVGMFSSYGDWIIGGVFLRLRAAEYKELLLEVTGNIRERFPDRFNRYLIQGGAHTTGEAGLDYEVGGTSVFEWLGQLVNDEEEGWTDRLE